jgi:ABC-2 type transport system ATP-binding protein
MPPAIKVNKLSKSYKIHQTEPGFLGSVKSLFNRQYRHMHAVSSLDLEIQHGELVGFIGPNGAGKTTTLKMLSGLLFPTSGDASVLGYTPWQRHPNFLRQFSLIMGQKAQLWWDLPLQDSLLLQRDIYDMNPQVYLASLAELIELLDLKDLLKTQIRKLSLGQRMRGELAAALIYQPKVLFLDEPTIGLDVVVQKRIREFIAAYQKKNRATIILTSHYLDDVRELCRRLIIIDHGRIMYDGTTDNLIKKHVDHKRISLTFSNNITKKDLSPFGKIVQYNPPQAAIQVPRTETTARAAAILTKLPVADISIEEPSLEDVVRELFTKHDYA